MPASAKVFIHYGPYDSCGIVNHRINRLEGMQQILENAGHSVQLMPINDWNVVEVWVNGEKVFGCDIRDLDFGGDGMLDPLCLEVLAQVNSGF